MKLSYLVPSVIAAAGIAVASSAFAPAQAALINGGGTCNLSNFTSYTDCGGFFDGNGGNAGDDGVAAITGNDDASDIGAIFGGLWEQVSKVESGTTSGVLTVNSVGQTSGTWSATGLNYSLYDYVAVIKAGNSFSAYKLTDATTSGNWDTLGVEPVGNNNTPGLSHLTLYKADAEPVPEPLTILGSATALGIGGLLKRQQSKKNNKA
ncbi:PEP-CTERM sorting domain-containing protein [Coleofasciculus chthonoplastes]|uniref:PEP-CTERM sorting domain-containing protein n=1 Tax=Coleofasciculus chthonoplastes TaxID=64178 RepID=UPI003302FABD